jgi:teichoic acid transport system permease protein
MEMSRAQIRASNSDTVFGVLWNVLNPLLLAVVYFILIAILQGGFKKPDQFAHILAGLFAFYAISGCMGLGASSVTSAGKIIMNTAFPRMLVVLSAVYISFRKFLPTIPVYILVAVATGVGVPWTAILAVPMFALIMVFGTGMALLLATAQVYFRDTNSFLPYVTRIWLYVSPVLWYPEQVPVKLRFLEVFNPLFSLLGGWGDLVVKGELIPWTTWVVSAVWAFGTLLVGAIVFMSRERDFAVRL